MPPSSAATEDDPAFVLKIGTNNLPLNFDSQSEFNASLDANFFSLGAATSGDAKTLADALIRQAENRSNWQSQFCAQNPFTNANCKLLPAEMDSYSYTDFASGKQVTVSYPRWIDFSAFDAATDYAGDVKTQFLPCSQTWSPDKELCPAGVTVDDAGNGTVSSYFATVGGVDKRLRLFCMDPSSNWIAYQEYAAAAVKATALDEARASRGCNLITAAGPYQNKYEAYRDALRMAFSEVTATAVNFGGKLCENYAVPADFKFSDCTQADVDQLQFTYWEATKPAWADDSQAKAKGLQGYESYFAKDRGKQELCRWRYWSLPDAQISSIDSSTGKITLKAGASLGEWIGQELCPAAYGDYLASNRADGSVFSAACVAEFNALTAVQQVSAGLRARTGNWDTLRYIGCTSMDPAVRSTFQTSLATQCLPQAKLAYICGGGGCTAALRCDGTKGGKCVDEFGTFIGRIANRVGVMNLKAQSDGAFQATNTVSDRWVSCDFSQGAKMKNCTLTNDTIINAKLAADGGGFSSFYKERVKQSCEEVSESTLAQACGGGMAGAAGNMQGGMPGGHQQRLEVPDTDILKRLIFTKCSNPTCS